MVPEYLILYQIIEGKVRIMYHFLLVFSGSGLRPSGLRHRGLCPPTPTFKHHANRSTLPLIAVLVYSMDPLTAPKQALLRSDRDI
jgi:hypothetical protein